MATDHIVPASENAEELIHSIKSVFGYHPADVLLSLKSTVEGLQWAEELFTVIATLCKDGGNESRTHTLAKIGQYITDTLMNYGGCELEKMRDKGRSVLGADMGA